MKTSLKALMISAALLFTGAATQAEASNPNANSNVVYYIPHQDDEALSFGVDIMNHIRGGHNVHVVLVTDGTATVVRNRLGMTREAFENARNKEFAYSLSIMGVKPENVRYEGLRDGTVSVAQMESIIKRYEKAYPKAKHKGFSYTDPHPDHYNTGKAMQNLSKSGVISDARYFVKQQDNPAGIRLIRSPFNEEYRPTLKAVGAAYKLNNAPLGFYGIGYRSVKNSFDSFERQPISRYHP